MENNLPFDDFIKTLRKTNRTLDFFVDWGKCVAHRDGFCLACKHLNSLLGVSPQDLLKKIAPLFDQHPQAFQILPLLLAIRDLLEIVLNPRKYHYKVI